MVSDDWQAASAPHSQVPVTVVDVDVHPAPRVFAELREYLPPAWRDRKFPDSVFDAIESPLYVAPNKAQRYDSVSPEGGPPCSDPKFTEKQLFEDAGVDYAIMIPLTVRPVTNPEHEAAMCSATNHWQAATWLSKYNSHGRYRGTLRVCSTDPDLAVREIEHWAGHPQFVQIMLNPYTRAPLGQSQYHKIYEVAAKHNLPICLHVNRSPGMGLLTPVGYASYFIEHHSLYPVMYATHLISMLTEGVFDRFPDLRVVFVEGGFSWFVPLMWKLEKLCKEYGGEALAMRRSPREYMKEHIRFSTQPVEEPTRLMDIRHILEWVDASNTLMFSTDYPHWDFDDPKWVLRLLPSNMKSKVLAENALDLYRLPKFRKNLGPSAARSLNISNSKESAVALDA
jgi:uncharacterized protein